MMTHNAQSPWLVEPSLAAVRDVVVSAEYACYGRPDVASGVVTDSPAEPTDLLVAAVEWLARLAAGHTPRPWERLRADARALEGLGVGDDSQARMGLVAAALSEALAKGQLDRCEQLRRSAPFADRGIARAACRLIAAQVYRINGSGSSAVFGELRRRCGLATL